MSDGFVLFELLDFYIKFFDVVIFFLNGRKAKILALFLLILVKQETVEVDNRVLTIPLVVFTGLLQLADLL